MNKQEVLDEIAALKEQLNNLEKFYDSFNPPYKRWRAKKDCNYYFISAGGKLCLDRENEVIEDGMRYAIGNYFKTEEEGFFEIERLKVIAELKEYATSVNEFDWSNFENKYVLMVEKNKEGNSILVIDDWRTHQFSDLYFASEEVAKNAIEAVGEERIIKYYFRRGENNADSD